MSETSHHTETNATEYIGEDFQYALYGHYGKTKDVEAAIQGWETTPSAYEPDRDVLYLRLGQYRHGQPGVYYVPGYSENIKGKLPTVLEFARQGYDTITANVNRYGVDESLEPTRSQALDHLEVIEAEGLTHTPLHLVGHSYGALILEEMIMIAREREWTCFEGMHAVLLAPAGVKEGKERYGSFGLRFLKSVLSENSSAKDFEDPDGEMFKATITTMTANKKRTLQEVTKEIMKDKVDFAALRANGIGRISVVGFAEDRLFPSHVLDSGVATTWEKDPDITYLNPYSTQQRLDGSVIGKDGATHNDDSFNPKRVVTAVIELLQQ